MAKKHIAYSMKDISEQGAIERGSVFYKAWKEYQVMEKMQAILQKKN